MADSVFRPRSIMNTDGARTSGPAPAARLRRDLSGGGVRGGPLPWRFGTALG
ncbi:hypothetical protein STVIR_6285 [Streptomyces viridochromogenes Tue57]|uniref:Uncharacterized protein n=1 Tax=Streptomyces viridochromogenes Tue57 TaxID=1160705 RepID=L8PBT0_STRVR|nr:hypothetical protein STVIR_6285 [Streptomyces viridochromogenes Tue57]